MEKHVFAFVEPRKKKGTVNSEYGPFPVPIQASTALDDWQWSYYQGQLIGNTIHIHSMNDMMAIYQMGFFGKGNLSWSAPEYNNVIVNPKHHLTSKKKMKPGKILRLFSRQRFAKHLEWQSAAKSAQQPENLTEDKVAEYGISENQTKENQTFEAAPRDDQFNNDTTNKNHLAKDNNYSCDKQQLNLTSLSEQQTMYNTLEHVDGDVLVVDNTEDEDSEESCSVSRKQWKDMVDRDPFPLKESLQLTFEEAFFLSYGLGCLILTDSNKEPMNLANMWQKFSELRPKFIPHYVAYHNFRSKGWVVRTGIKYGVDFLLYRKGPPFYHSSYSVIVVAVDEESDFEKDKSSTDWTSFCCMNRVTEQVSKELMICYVIRPKDLTSDCLLNPRCISQFKISEFIIRRWVSKKERENADYLEMP